MSLAHRRCAETDPEDVDYGDGAHASLVEMDDSEYDHAPAAPSRCATVLGGECR